MSPPLPSLLSSSLHPFSLPAVPPTTTTTTKAPQHYCPDASDPLLTKAGKIRTCGSGFDGLKMCPKGFYCAINADQGSELRKGYGSEYGVSYYLSLLQLVFAVPSLVHPLVFPINTELFLLTSESVIPIRVKLSREDHFLMIIKRRLLLMRNKLRWIRLDINAILSVIRRQNVELQREREVN